MPSDPNPTSSRVHRLAQKIYARLIQRREPVVDNSKHPPSAIAEVSIKRAFEFEKEWSYWKEQHREDPFPDTDDEDLPY